MQKYFLQETDFINNKITNSDYHHIKNVMRMKENDKIIVSYNKKSYYAVITKIDECIEFNILEEIKSSQELPKKITLLQGLPKKDKLEYIIEKNTELGIDEIIPVQMNRSIAKKSDKENNKLERYNRIAKEASEQSNRNQIPVIFNTLENIKKLDYSKYDLKFVCCFVDYKNTKNKIEKLILDKNNYNILFAVGPEGGLTNEEIDYFIKNGFIKLSLGPRTLRCETASMYFLSMISYILEMGDDYE